MIQTHIVSLFTRLGHDIMVGADSLLSTIGLNTVLTTPAASITGSIRKVFVSLHASRDQKCEREDKISNIPPGVIILGARGFRRRFVSSLHGYRLAKILATHL